MLTQRDISDTIVQAKYFAGDMIAKIIELEANGNDVKVARTKFVIFMKWIKLLDDYLNYNYDENGVIAEPDYECLTADQAQSLVAKLKITIDCKKYVLADWILANGTWTDTGRWRDSEVWNDSVVWS